MASVRFANGCGHRLSGELYPARDGGDAVVVFAHGYASEKTSKGRFPPLAGALNEIGLSCLAFDFRGCGHSDDDTLTAAKQVQDLRAAAGFVRDEGFRRVALYGHSLGTLICLRAYEPGIVAMALSGALTGPMHYDWAKIYSAEQMRQLADTGRITMRCRIRPERKVVVEAQMLRDFAEINQAALLGGVDCPVMIIHGDGDDEEERMLLEHSRAGMQYLPAGSRLQVIPGAVHGFYEHQDELIGHITEWFAHHMPA